MFYPVQDEYQKKEVTIRAGSFKIKQNHIFLIQLGQFLAKKSCGAGKKQTRLFTDTSWFVPFIHLFPHSQTICGDPEVTPLHLSQNCLSLTLPRLPYFSHTNHHSFSVVSSDTGRVHRSRWSRSCSCSVSPLYPVQRT